MRRYDYPEVVVGAMVLDRKGRVLLVRSEKWPNIYSVPGGHVELGESIYDATLRETMEETGLKVKPVRALNLQEAVFPKEFHRKAHFIFIDVLCRADSTYVRLDNRELYDYKWIKPKDSLRLRLNTYTRRAIRQLAGKSKKEWFYAEAE